MNEVILVGRLTKDPELQYTPNTQAEVCKFTLAVDRPRHDNNQVADFIRVTVFGKQAVNIDRYLRKGSQLAVNGRIQTGSYTNRNGVTVYTTDVIGERVEFLGSPSNQQQPASVPAPELRQMEMNDIPDTFQATEEYCPF